MAEWESRFWSKVERTDPSSCWLWRASCWPSGYGRFSISRKDQAAHRVAYELLVGPIPAGLQLDHLCRVRSCVNPAHLEPVTLRENLRRGDGVTGRRSRQTHCVHGHEFTPKNTYVRANGCRTCRACMTYRARARWQLAPLGPPRTAEERSAATRRAWVTRRRAVGLPLGCSGVKG